VPTSKLTIIYLSIYLLICICPESTITQRNNHSSQDSETTMVYTENCPKYLQNDK